MDQDSDNALLARQLANLLIKEGYRAKVNSDMYIESGVGGYSVIIIPYPPNTFQIACGFEANQLRFDHDDINKFNAKYRFSKLYSDEDGDLALTTDIVINVLEANASEIVRYGMLFHETSLRLLTDIMVKE